MKTLPLPRVLRITNRGREQLIQIKRYVRFENWNVVCRWAFVQSLNETTVPPKLDSSGDSAVEMTWDVFSGGTGRVYWEVLIQWALDMGLDPESEDLENLFRRHVHRGIAAIAGRSEFRSIEGLVERVAMVGHGVS